MSKINHERLDRVYERLRLDPHFEHLRTKGNPLIEGEGGDPIAFIVGEAPGATEVRAKRPFVGPAGTVLRQLMAHTGLYATGVDNKTDWVATEWNPNCWLTNVVKWRPPSNRTPTFQELMDSRRSLRAEWVAVGRPDIIITVGASPLTAVMGRKKSVLSKAGQMFSNYDSEREPSTMVFWPMIHPAFGLRNEAVRPMIEEHWERLRVWLANHPRWSKSDYNMD
jgi:uracil-DNA glycosylase family 4